MGGPSRLHQSHQPNWTRLRCSSQPQASSHEVFRQIFGGRKYEALLADPNASKEELQRLEMYLETKEEEIREVIARINEVEELNDRVRGEMPVRGSSLEPYKSTTSAQLWQTLRRVQQFKEDISRHTSRISCAKSSY